MMLARQVVWRDERCCVHATPVKLLQANDEVYAYLKNGWMEEFNVTAMSIARAKFGSAALTEHMGTFVGDSARCRTVVPHSVYLHESGVGSGGLGFALR